MWFVIIQQTGGGAGNRSSRCPGDQSQASPSCPNALEQGLREEDDWEVVEGTWAPEWKGLSPVPCHPAGRSEGTVSGQIPAACQTPTSPRRQHPVPGRPWLFLKGTLLDLKEEREEGLGSRAAAACRLCFYRGSAKPGMSEQQRTYLYWNPKSITELILN